MADRLSTCDVCGFTIEQRGGTGWHHIVEPHLPHRPEPNDGYVCLDDDADVEPGIQR